MAKELIYIVTPHNTLFPHTYMLSYAHTWKELRDKYELGVSFCEGALVHANRNVLIKNALRDKADYMMCIDSDIIWTPDDIEKLIATGKDVVSGIYPCRIPVNNEYYPQLYMRMPQGEYAALREPPSELSKVDATGMGFMLVRKNIIEDILDKFPYPFDMLSVKEVDGKDNGKTELIGEDMCFCYRLKEIGVDIWCEPTVMVGHYTPMAIRTKPCKSKIVKPNIL